MISSFLGLQTSLRGLLAQQQALDVAAHNVANANTVGYTRQEATLGAANPLHLSAGVTQNGAGAFLGQGVDVTAYRRVRDSFLDLQVRAQNMALGDATTSAEALDRVQTAIGEPSTTGVNALLGKFYTAWSDLAKLAWIVPPTWASSRIKLNQMFYKHKLHPPADIVAECTSPAGTPVVLGVATATDQCDATPTISNNAASAAGS